MTFRLPARQTQYRHTSFDEACLRGLLKLAQTGVLGSQRARAQLQVWPAPGYDRSTAGTQFRKSYTPKLAARQHGVFKCEESASVCPSLFLCPGPYHANCCRRPTNIFSCINQRETCGTASGGSLRRAGGNHSTKQLQQWLEADFLQCCSAQYCDLSANSRSTIAAAFNADGSLLASTQCAIFSLHRPCCTLVIAACFACAAATTPSRSSAAVQESASGYSVATGELPGWYDPSPATIQPCPATVQPCELQPCTSLAPARGVSHSFRCTQTI
jgi:hypothetical protein